MSAIGTASAPESVDARLRVGVICDLQEEGWPSMQLVADMLLSSLQRDYAEIIHATRIQPAMKMRFAKLSQPGNNGHSTNASLHANGMRFNADRVLNRFWDYPQHLRPLAGKFDLFHVIDHSYAQVVHALPSERTVVTCHDLDTFQCLLNPPAEPRSLAFKRMISRTLSGFRRAAYVTCDSHATRDELLAHGLVDADRAVVIQNGVDEACTPEPDQIADAEVDRLLCEEQGANWKGPGKDAFPLARNSSRLDILHVGSTIPRKRIDTLLHLFARLREQFPNARLLRVGGKLAREQAKLMRELGITDSVVQLPHLDRRTLAAIYRRAAIVLLPSEREGFGLPVVEAMACGTPVVASDLPVLREVGGDAASYCPVADIEAWVETIALLLREKEERPEAWAERCSAGLRQASKFSWTEYARKTVEVYRSVLAETKG